MDFITILPTHFVPYVLVCHVALQSVQNLVVLVGHVVLQSVQNLIILVCHVVLQRVQNL